MEFVLPVSDRGVQQRHTTTLHVMLAFLLFGIGVTCEALYWFTSISPKFATTGAYQPFLFFGLACIAGSVAILLLTIFQKSWLRKERNNLLFRLIELALLVLSSALFFLHGWKSPAILFGLMSAVVIFALVRERMAGIGSNITIDEKGIFLPLASRNKFLPWREIASVILRFGILSIEYTGNHLMQQNIGDPMPDAAALEAFCREQVELHKSERSDW